MTVFILNNNTFIQIHSQNYKKVQFPQYSKFDSPNTYIASRCE